MNLGSLSRKAVTSADLSPKLTTLSASDMSRISGGIGSLVSVAVLYRIYESLSVGLRPLLVARKPESQYREVLKESLSKETATWEKLSRPMRLA